MGIGRVINLGVNALQGNVHSWGEGIGYFATGVATAEVTLYGGPVAGGGVSGAGNDLTSQIAANGIKNVDLSQTLFSGFEGGATAYVGGQITGFVSPYVSGVTSKIASPVVQQALAQGVTNSASEFAIGAGISLLNGNDINTALKEGVKNALFGGGLGLMNGFVTGYKYAKDHNMDPLSGEKIHGYHSDPIFMGGDRDQELTYMKDSTHRSLHNDMNDFVCKQTDSYENHMRPQSNNSGLNIQGNFSRLERINSLQLFYDNNKWIYPWSRYDFYKNNGLTWKLW